jgi:phosphate starvation-inducible PhoH-like protein
MSTPAHLDLVLEPDDAERLASLNGAFDAHLRQIELKLGIEVRNRGNFYRLLGPEPQIARGQTVIEQLFEQSATSAITTEQIHLALLEVGGPRPSAEELLPHEHDEVVVRTRRGVVRGRTPLQKKYLKAIAGHDVSFGKIGRAHV